MMNDQVAKRTADLCRLIDDHESGRKVMPGYPEKLDELIAIGKGGASAGGVHAMLRLSSAATEIYATALTTTSRHQGGICGWER